MLGKTKPALQIGYNATLYIYPMEDVREYEYRDTLIDAVILLEKMERKLFTVIVNSGMYGIHQQVHEVLDVGDSMDFELAMFEDSGDVNLEKMVSLIKHVSEVKGSIMNLNNIKEGDIE